MDEERLERLTYTEIKEIAEQGVEPDLTTHRKRQIIKENFSWFFIKKLRKFLTNKSSF